MWIAFISGLGLATLQSWHCMAMCGFLSSFGFYFYLGRIISYSILGLVAGYFSNYFLNTSTQILQILFIIFILISAFYILAKDIFPNIPKYFLLSFSPINKIHKINVNIKTPFLKGLLWGFMPCHFLWLQLFISASFGSQIIGALYMFCFSFLTTFGLSIIPLIKSKLLIFIQNNSFFQKNNISLKFLKLFIFIIFLLATLWSLNTHTEQIGKSISNKNHIDWNQLICW